MARLKQPAQIRVICVDNHQALLDLGSAAIDREDDMAVLAVAGSAEEALPLIRRLRPDITVIDLGLPGMCGIDLIKTIRRERLGETVVFTGSGRQEDPYDATFAGARGYVNKTSHWAIVLQALRCVAAGNIYRDEGVADLLVEQGVARRRTGLTPRELEVLRGLMNRFDQKSVAAELGITVRTVENHIGSVYRKLGVQNLAGAIDAAERLGIL